jgi:hypothetical protein
MEHLTRVTPWPGIHSIAFINENASKYWKALTHHQHERVSISSHQPIAVTTELSHILKQYIFFATM